MKTTEQEPTVIDTCKAEQDNKAAAAETSRLEQKHRILLSLSALTDTIKDLLRIGNALLSAGIPLGAKPKTFDLPGATTLVSNGWSHRLGYILHPGEKKAVAIGIIGGGYDRKSIAVDAEGKVTTLRGVWTPEYEDEHPLITEDDPEFNDKAKKFLDGFDAFNKAVSEYIESLASGIPAKDKEPEKTKETNPLDFMTAEEIRKHLTEDYRWDAAAMANAYSITPDELTGYLQCGGKPQKEEKKEERQPVKASYHVVFSPMTSVEAEVIDPENPTDKELAAIAEKAFQNVSENAAEKLSAENISMVRLYRIEGNGSGLRRGHYIFGHPEYEAIDPAILVEMTQLTYQKLYEKFQDGVEVSNLIRDFARKLTETYKNTDWLNCDFWLTMEEEADDFLEKQK